MGGEVILVAVDASKEITDYALEWAVRNVTKAMDFLILLAILPSCARPPAPAAAAASGNETYQSHVYQFLSGLLKKRDDDEQQQKQQQGSSDKSRWVVDGHDVPQRINSVCVQMMQQQLLSLHNLMQVRTKVKVVADAQMGSVAMVAVELGATWVILDRRLKKEADCCLTQLNCNVILIDHAIPNILRSVNFPKAESVATQSILGVDSPYFSSEISHLLDKYQFKKTSPVKPANKTSRVTKFKPANSSSRLKSYFSDHEAEIEAAYGPIPPYSKSQPLAKVSKFDIKSPPQSSASPIDKKKTRSYNSLSKTRSDSASFTPPRSSDSPNSLRKLKSPNQSGQPTKRRESMLSKANEVAAFRPTIDRASSVRRAISLSIKQPPTPPPLCSICKNNAPFFGKAPRRFGYKEIERATNGFSNNNFLAEGGFGPVYRGVLPDGQVVAVKQHKQLSAQGASEFCSEVEVLSCAQHKNLVMLVGYCIEREWLLVYEFACNGSLDKHLYGTYTKEVMAWQNRMKVAVGAARGLRYLHEDCRVGCIVHRDFRPTNILLTHDFEPMVGDFGLARWQVDGQSAEETRVIGAFGYLAPEYTQTGIITEKTDVYAFGVVLLELLTGIKATEFSRNIRQLHLLEQGCSLLERKIYNELIDPRLENNYMEKEVECMLHAATLCISPQPERRPRISKVLKMLEGDNNIPSYTASSDHHHGEQSRAVYPKQSLDGYTAGGPRNQMLDDSSSPSHPMQSIHCMIHLNLSKESSAADRNTDQKSRLFKPTGDRGGLNQHELIVNQEYQEYLRGSLSKFIESLTVK